VLRHYEVAKINLGQSLVAQLHTHVHTEIQQFVRLKKVMIYMFLFLPCKEDNGPYQTCDMFGVKDKKSLKAEQHRGNTYKITLLKETSNLRKPFFFFFFFFTILELGSYT